MQLVWLFCIITIAVTFGSYFPTVTKGVPGGDSGELLAEACGLGVAHPPGYPLFVYSARAAIDGLGWLYGSSFGTPAYRVNVASAALAALTAGMLAYATASVLRRVHDRVHAGLGASKDALPSTAVDLVICSISACTGCLWSLSPLTWLYAIGAEVFTLNNALCTALLVLLAAYGAGVDARVAARGPDGAHSTLLYLHRGAHVLAFTCGLAMTNQHTSLFLVLPLAAVVAIALWPGLAWAQVATLFIAALCGLLPYLHMPIAHSLWRGPGSWGDTSTLQGFLRHLLRQDYGTFRLLARDKGEGHSEGPTERTLAYFRDVTRTQLPQPLLVLCVVLGLAACFACAVHALAQGKEAKQSRSVPGKPKVPALSAHPLPWAHVTHAHKVLTASLVSFPALALLFYLVTFHSLSNMPLKDPLLYGIHARFWLQPNLLLSMCLAVGLYVPVHLLGAKVGGDKGMLAWLLPAAVMAACASLVSLQYARSLPQMIVHGSNDVFDRYARALLLPLPPSAVLVTSYDFQWTAARYLQACEGIRADVAILNAPIMSYSWFSTQRVLYPRIAWPGTHLVTHMTAAHAEGGFSLPDWLTVNLGDACGLQYMSSYLADVPHWGFHARQVNSSSEHSPRLHAAGTLQHVPAEYPILQGAQHSATAVPPSACRGRHGGLFWAGMFNHRGDLAHTYAYELQPWGAVGRVVFKKEGGEQGVRTWKNLTASPLDPTLPAVLGPDRRISDGEVSSSESSWRAGHGWYNGKSHASLVAFDESLWERATRIEYWTSAVSYGTWLLEWALEEPIQTSRRAAAGVSPAPSGIEAIDTRGVLLAAGLLEEALWQQTAMNATTSPLVYKNLGLAYVRLVRWPFQLLGTGEDLSPLVSGNPVLPPVPRLRPGAVQGKGGATGPLWALSPANMSLADLPLLDSGYPPVSEETWRTLAAERVLECWAHFLLTQEGKADPARATIAAVVDTLRRAAGGAGSRAGQAGSASKSGEGRGSAAGMTGGQGKEEARAPHRQQEGGRGSGRVQNKETVPTTTAEDGWD